ncbi:MAG: L-threonylcarbamoyladenylate synthase, partial [Spirochaetia bacterium]|nr:L-threonylcarbamoyladenylate synthase [Spirochaetia bacterium]
MRRVTAIEAAQILRDGGIVVFPTETVYGLAANAMDHAAVNRLYELKGREAENKPFTCQVPDTESVFQFAVRSPIAVRLASFWPGPITLVLPALPEQNHLPLPAKPRSAARIPAWVTGGSSFCGFRIPDEEQALAMLRAAGVPVAAPSANFTGRKPPVSFDEIDPELLERV